ncbi:TIGR04053 family radical SAM/SPASM domain-containing protein [Luteococcus sediminum]
MSQSTSPVTTRATGARRSPVRELRHDPDDRPFIVIWEVTRACQLACAHCRADAQQRFHPDQLTTTEGRALLDDIAQFGKPTPIVILTGGDPFERTDLEELVAHGNRLGLSMALSPSVTANFTAQRLASLRAAGGKAISLSLDAAHAELHDAFRGFSGTYDATLAAALVVNEAGFRLQINSTITRRTVTELPDLMVQVKQMGTHLWSLFFLVPTGRGQALQALDAQENEDVLQWAHDVSGYIAIKTTEAQAYRRVAMQRDTDDAPPHGALYDQLMARTLELVTPADLENRRPRPPLATNSGRGFVFIDHVGDVYPSGFLPHHCGNVKSESFRGIYRNSPVMLSLRRPDEFHGKCGVCPFNQVCGGSRSHAYAVTGDLLASDPTCAYIPPRWLAEHDGDDPITGARAPAAG